MGECDPVVCDPVSGLVVRTPLRPRASVGECPFGLASGAVCAVLVVTVHTNHAVSGDDCVSDAIQHCLCVYV